MLVSGVITCTMALAIVAPQLALELTFGESISGPIAEIITRNWGALVTLIGVMLIYAAFHPVHRRLVLIVASISKIVFIALIVSVGRQYLDKAALALIIDSVVVALYIIYLVNTINTKPIIVRT
jgi:O-antigen/teichoic acid export membrane protein